MKQGILKMVRDGLTKMKNEPGKRGGLLAVPLRKFDMGRKMSIRLLQREECDCAA